MIDSHDNSFMMMSPKDAKQILPVKTKVLSLADKKKALLKKQKNSLDKTPFLCCYNFKNGMKKLSTFVKLRATILCVMCIIPP